jgi:hypothetical protein
MSEELNKAMENLAEQLEGRKTPSSTLSEHFKGTNLRGAINRYFETESTDSPIHLIETEGSIINFEGYLIKDDFDIKDFFNWLGHNAILYVQKIVTPTTEEFYSFEMIQTHSKPLRAKVGNVIVRITSTSYDVL